MNQKKVGVALAIAAAAVVLENVIYWQSGAPPAVASPEEEAALAVESEASEETAAVADVDAARVHAYLASLPNPERARSPFLTRAEADSLAVADPGASGPVLTLVGTLFGAERRVAWLDGAPLVEGDFVDGREVLRIETRSVVLDDGGAELRVFVQEPPEPAGAAGDAELLKTLEEETP
ncbi:MAG TPA: hypothetical protein VFT98_08760 [Myxococcota bacterium]|nr:hypothetical protein [Myxococcota bacterium]